MRLTRRGLTVSCNHDVVATKSVAYHSAVLLIEDVLGLHSRTKNFVESVSLFPGSVGKAFFAPYSPVQPFLLLKESVGAAVLSYVYVLGFKSDRNVEMVEQGIQLHLVDGHKGLCQI